MEAARPDKRTLSRAGWFICTELLRYNPCSFVEHGWCVTEEIQYRLLKILEDNPDITQRELAAQLGISLGKANYCVRALIGKGWVKATNFRRNPNKIGYVYLLTPKGIEEKARIAVGFLRHKLNEFDVLKAEIERLTVEVADSAVNPAVLNPPARPLIE